MNVPLMLTQVSDAPALGAATLAAVQEIYDDAIRQLVHQRW